jgi:hypothetical protein
MTDPGFFPAPQEDGFSPEEENVVKARLFALLAKQVRLKTQGDHSSLREEDVAELLDSAVFTLRYGLLQNGQPTRALLTVNLAELLKQGQAALQVCFDEAKVLHEAALESVSTLGNRSLADTLAGIGMFFRRYDIRLYAHQIPASVDYQLCLPVPPELRGALYIHSYLKRLLIENALVRYFAPALVEALLHRVAPDNRELLINLYEPVAANTVGLALLREDETSLALTPLQAAQVHLRLVSLPPADARKTLVAAAEAACRNLAITDSDSRAYLAQTAETLYPRIILSPQSAAGVFYAGGNRRE